MPSKNMLPKGQRHRSVRQEYRATRGVEQRLLFEEIAVRDALVDAREVLIDHASSAHRHVADFGIAHLA